MNKSLGTVVIFFGIGYCFSARLVEQKFETFLTGSMIRCIFSEAISVAYQPGFFVSVDAPRNFRRKIFFYRDVLTLGSDVKKEYVGDSYKIYFKTIKIPIPGLLIICTYDPEKILFSWMHNASLYAFYFNQKTIVVPQFNDHSSYALYAFYKYLPQIVPMC